MEQDFSSLILGKPLTKLTLHDIQQYFKEARTESDKLEYKSFPHNLVTEGNEGYVQAIIMQEMEKAIGFGPRLQVEWWTPENLCFGDGAPFIHYGKAAA
jgi:hypothetical protein